MDGDHARSPLDMHRPNRCPLGANCSTFLSTHIHFRQYRFSGNICITGGAADESFGLDGMGTVPTGMRVGRGLFCTDLATIWIRNLESDYEWEA